MLKSTNIEAGDRVRLKPFHDWLDTWRPLANSGRLGTVTSVGESQVVIQFDAARDGAKQRTANFSRDDIELVARGPGQPPEQPNTLPI
jgi:hypothetical protein